MSRMRSCIRHAVEIVGVLVVAAAAGTTVHGDDGDVINVMMVTSYKRDGRSRACAPSS